MEDLKKYLTDQNIESQEANVLFLQFTRTFEKNKNSDKKVKELKEAISLELKAFE